MDTETQTLNECRQSFREAQTIRKEKFMKTFDHISRNIELIYKEMTRSAKNHNFGGTALLYADDNIEPYNGGINYSPTPPGKRCMYEMDELSGGEKTIAALSLLFAIHSANPAPFYILDEVDAHLDWENCALLLKYINKIATEST
ncbi:MAG: hypothetical protein V2I33_24330 [Kangiellaceae bacterium]|nr:hypothetical protein [Kangiellaceae bacterium]